MSPGFPISLLTSSSLSFKNTIIDPVAISCGFEIFFTSNCSFIFIVGIMLPEVTLTLKSFIMNDILTIVIINKTIPIMKKIFFIILFTNTFNSSIY